MSVYFIAVCRRRLDLAFIVDGSGSIGLVNFKRTLNFVRHLVASFVISPSQTRIAFMEYNTRPFRAFTFGQKRTLRAVLASVSRIPYVKGGTKTGRALRAAFKFFKGRSSEIIDKETLVELLKRRGRVPGNKPLTEEYLSSTLGIKSFEEFAEKLLSGEIKLHRLKDTKTKKWIIKPVFRLHPPRDGFDGSIKLPYQAGGELGYRGTEINRLLRKMM